MKKLISICLTICMLLSMVSALNVYAAPAFAGSYNSADAAYKNGYVSTVGNVKAAIRNGADAVAGVDYQASSSAPWGGNGYFVMVHGDWAYIDLDMPYTGVYVMQMCTDWANNYPITYQVTTEEGYAAEFNITQGSWSSGCNQDQLIYLKAGKNTVKVQLVGDNNAILSCIDFGALNASGAEKSLDYLPLVKLASDLVDPSLKPTPTPEPTPTPKAYFPEGWDGVVENHPDAILDSAMEIEGYFPDMSSDEGTELFGTDWGVVGETGAFANKGQQYALYLPAGSSATYTLTNIPSDGVYTAQVKVGTAAGATTLQMMNTVDGVNYYAEYNVKNLNSWNATWSNNASLNIDDFIYLQAGSNEITIYNAGPNPINFFETDYGCLNNNENYMQYVGTDEDTAGIKLDGWDGNTRNLADWNGKYTSGFGGYNTGDGFNEVYFNVPYTENGIDLSADTWANYTIDAPAAGMYLVEAVAGGEGTLTLTTQDLDYATFNLAELDPQYIYLAAGENVITATGTDGTEFIGATFYQLNNSSDYLSQRENVNDLPEEPYNMAIVPSSAIGSTGYGYFAWGYDSGAAIVQYAGSSAQYELNVYFPGIYRVQAKVGGTTNAPYPVLNIDVNETYRATLVTDYADDWGSWRATDANGAYQYVYLEEGTNFIEVFSGGTHHVLHSVDFVLLTAEEEATITMDDLQLAPAKPLSIRPARDAITTTKNVDYFLTRTNLSGPVLNNNENYLTAELVPGEWMRFELTAKTAGYYQLQTTAAVYNAEGEITVETDSSVGCTKHVASPDNYRTFTGEYVYLHEGVNNVWVSNTGSGFFYLKEVKFTYAEDQAAADARIFVPAHKYVGAAENAADIAEYTVRNNYYGIHVANPNNGVVDTTTKTYNVSILKDDYYGLLMTATMPLTGTINVTVNDGVNGDIVLFNDVSPYFGNENTVNTITLTAEKVFLPAGEYTMTFTFTENNDANSGNSLMNTHIHGFELTTLTRQDALLAALQAAGSTEDIAEALEEYADVLADDIGADVENDFIYPEYAYNALLNCAMLESGAYETYDDVLAAYDFAKNMITVADDGTGNLVYTVQVGDWNEVGTTVLVAVYMENGQLYMMGEGYLEYDEAVGTYLPVEATLYDYIPEAGDQIKVFIWDNFDGLKPVF